MREGIAYISVEDRGKDEKGNELYKVHAIIKLPLDRELASNQLQSIGKRIREGSKRDIICSKFHLELKISSGKGGNVVSLDSGEFIRPPKVNHVWIMVDDPETMSPDGGAVGNYDDPDD